MTTRRNVIKAAAPALAAGAVAPAGAVSALTGEGAVETNAQQRRELIGEPAPGGLPFSAAVRYGGLLFVSGNVGNRPGTLELVEGGIGPEARQALENIRATLELAGSSLGRVLKVTVFLADIDEYAAMNEVYREFFGTQPPARSTMAASGLAIGARVEIEAIAAAS
jgi:2-iminobutanoate/2-iminopropanoate deaminase